MIVNNNLSSYERDSGLELVTAAYVLVSTDYLCERPKRVTTITHPSTMLFSLEK